MRIAKTRLIFAAMVVLCGIPAGTQVRLGVGVMGGIKHRARTLHRTIHEQLVYPDTDQPPRLTIRWWTGSTIPKDDVLSINTFGNKKLNMPGVSGQFTMWVASSGFKPIYALCDGVVVSLERGFDRDHQVVRYGRNYAIEYCHVVNLNPDLAIGKIVRTGERIGDMWEMSSGQGVPPGTGYFEIRFLKRTADGRWIMANIYDYLEPVSQENIREIWLEKAFSPTSTAGSLTADGKFLDYFGNEITTATICGVMREIDIPGLDFTSYILYDYRK